MFAEPAKVHRDHFVLRSVAIKEPGSAHVAKGFVVPVGFTVRSDAHQLGVFAVRVKGILDPLAKDVRVAQEMFKPDSARKPRIVEENVQVAVANFIALGIDRENPIRARRIDVRVFAWFPVTASERSEAFGLGRRKNRKQNPFADQIDDNIHVDGGFGKPHRLRLSPEMRFEIADSPADLRYPVLFRSERHNDVVIHLRDGVSVSETLDTLRIGFLNPTVGLRQVRPNPADKGRSEIETHVLVIVYNILNPSRACKDSACRIRAVALRRDPVVPIVERAALG